MLFLKLGVIGFGGPAAHIALMRDEVVRRRRWLDDAEFLRLVGACNLIPGPNSTELAIHLGHRRAGWRGLVLAGAAFIGPAVVIVGVLAWLYERYGTDPTVLDLRYGILPVIVAIVGQALHGLAAASLTRPAHVLLAAAAAAGFLAGVHELAILAVAGAASALVVARPRPRRRGPGFAALVLPLTTASTRSIRAGLWPLFCVFLGIGRVLYGSGYVLLAFLQRNIVDERGWLSTEQLLDAVAVGQVTPGPVFSTATFVGWQVAGPAGAAVATAGIFAPSFLFVALLSRILPVVERHRTARAALDGVTLASLGLMAGVLVELVRTAVIDGLTAAIAVTALAVAIRYRVNTVWLVGAGALIGALRALL